MSSCEVEELRALEGGTGAVGEVVTSDRKSWKLLRDQRAAAELFPSARLSMCGQPVRWDLTCGTESHPPKLSPQL